MKTFLHSILLVSTLLFPAGCASVGNNFNESNLARIKKGEATEAQLVEMLGQPQNRVVNSESEVILNWMYAEATIKGESFIPYAGAFLGDNRSQQKTLTVTLAADKVTTFSYSGGGSESRGTTQRTPKS